MNRCPRERHLTAWLLGDLPPAEAEALRGHLATCDACRATAAELEPVVAALRAGLAARPAKPPRLHPARRRRVLATPCRSGFRRWWSRPHRGLALAATMAIIAGLVLSAIVFPASRRAREIAITTANNCYCFEMPDPFAREDAAPAVESLPAPSLQPQEDVFGRDTGGGEGAAGNGATTVLSGPEASAAPKAPAKRGGDALLRDTGLPPAPPAEPAAEQKQPADRRKSPAAAGKGAAPPAAAMAADEKLQAPAGWIGRRQRGDRPADKEGGTEEDVQFSITFPAGPAVSPARAEDRDSDHPAAAPANAPAPAAPPVALRSLRLREESAASAGRLSEVATEAAAEVEDRAGRKSDQSCLARSLAPPAPAAAAAPPRKPRSAAAPAEEKARRTAEDAAPPSGHERPPAIHNPFVETRENPFSTFAIDVDTASYTMTRQALLSGSLPDPGSVRTEEFVNAFDYGDSAPETAVFRVYPEGAPSPFGAGLDLLRIGVKGRRLGREEQRPAMLTFLVDTSGSMDRPDRIGLARQALALLLGHLAPEDRLQLIAFDDHARLVLEAVPGTGRERVLAAFDSLRCRGSTNLEEGMRLAYELAARAFVPGAENRVILISDGVANLGADSAAEILARIERYRRQGITCSVFGVGHGACNDRLLEELADRGDGVYRFLDSPEEVRRVFVDDMAATLHTIAMDVKIQVEWNPAAVVRYRLLGYENRALAREQFRDDAVDAGEVGSGQSVTALYELERAAAAPHDCPLGVVRVRYRRVDTGAVEEIAQPILRRHFAARIEEARPELRLAACAAEFAELLRRSPHAAGGSFADVARLLHAVVLEKELDSRVAELLRLVELAAGMTR